MAVIGTIRIALTAVTSGLKKGLDQADKSISGFSRRLSGADRALGGFGSTLVGTFAAGAIVSKLASTADQMDRIGKTAAKLGIAEAKLIGLQHAADQSGVGADAMSVAIQRMTRRISQASVSADGTAKALAEMGLSAADLKALSPDQALARIADGMQKVDSQSDRVRLAFALFDTEGVGLVNTLANGSEGLRQWQAEAEKLGLVVPTGPVQDMNDAIDEAGKTIDGVFRAALNKSAPAIEWFSLAIVDLKLNVMRTGAVLAGFTGLAVKRLADAMIRLVEIHIQLTGTGEEVRAKLQEISEWGATVFRNNRALVDAWSNLDTTAESLKSSLEDLNEAAEEFDFGLKVESEGSAAADWMRELRAEAKRLAESVKTPEERFSDLIEKIEGLNEIGLITDETLKRLEAKALADLEAATTTGGDPFGAVDAKTFEPAAVAAAERGSAAALSAINRPRGLEDIQKKALKEAEKQTEKLGEIEQGLRGWTGELTPEELFTIAL